MVEIEGREQLGGLGQDGHIGEAGAHFEGYLGGGEVACLIVMCCNLGCVGFCRSLL